MGDFRGHFGPATFFLLCGIYLYLKASMFKATEGLRYSYIGLLIPGLVGMLGSFALGFGEYIVSGNPSLHSHQDHFRMNFGVFVLAGVYVLHLSGFLKGKFWGLIESICFLTIGILTVQHPQATLAHTMAHHIAGYFFMTFAVCFAVEYLCACFLTPSKEDERLYPILKSKVVNHIYANPAVYKTPFPMLTAFILLINGVWWYQMSYYLFTEDLPLTKEELDSPHMAPMYVGGLFYNTLIFTSAFLVFFHLCGTWLDSQMHPGKRVGIAAEELEEVEA